MTTVTEKICDLCGEEIDTWKNNKTGGCVSIKGRWYDWYTSNPNRVTGRDYHGDCWEAIEKAAMTLRSSAMQKEQA